MPPCLPCLALQIGRSSSGQHRTGYKHLARYKHTSCTCQALWLVRTGLWLFPGAAEGTSTRPLVPRATARTKLKGPAGTDHKYPARVEHTVPATTIMVAQTAATRMTPYSKQPTRPYRGRPISVSARRRRRRSVATNATDQSLGEETRRGSDSRGYGLPTCREGEAAVTCPGFGLCVQACGFLAKLNPLTARYRNKNV